MCCRSPPARYVDRRYAARVGGRAHGRRLDAAREDAGRLPGDRAPGHANSIHGIAAAQATGVPMLAVSGMSDSRARDRFAFQDMDQLKLVQALQSTRGAGEIFAAAVPREARISRDAA